MGPASYIFILSSFADLAWNHVPHGASLRVTLVAFALKTWLVGIYTYVWIAQPLLLMWIALFSWTFCGLASDMLLVFGWPSREKIIWKSNTISGKPYNLLQHKVEYAWKLTKYTESRLTKKLSCEIVCKYECGLFNLTVVLAKSCRTGLLRSRSFWNDEKRWKTKRGIFYCRLLCLFSQDS